MPQHVIEGVEDVGPAPLLAVGGEEDRARPADGELAVGQVVGQRVAVLLEPAPLLDVVAGLVELVGDVRQAAQIPLLDRPGLDGAEQLQQAGIPLQHRPPQWDGGVVLEPERPQEPLAERLGDPRHPRPGLAVDQVDEPDALAGRHRPPADGVVGVHLADVEPQPVLVRLPRLRHLHPAAGQGGGDGGVAAADDLLELLEGRVVGERLAVAELHDVAGFSLHTKGGREVKRRKPPGPPRRGT